jgi:type 1 glutamine amidotransferase
MNQPKSQFSIGLRSVKKYIPVTAIPLAGHLLIALLLTIANLEAQTTPAAKSGLPPLRVFMRSGPKSHGPGDHDHPSFLRDWTKVLAERGAFPTAEQLAKTDVVIIHRQVGGNFSPAELAIIDPYAKRGGGFVVIHAGNVAGGDASADYYRDLIGGSWRQKVTKWREGQIKLNFVDKTHAISQGVEGFGMKDEIYYEMDLRADIHVLATAPTPKKKGDDFEAQPQIWTYEKPNAQRAFVFIPGHAYVNFSRPDVSRLLLRGIAWAAKREDLMKMGDLPISLTPAVPAAGK